MKERSTLKLVVNKDRNGHPQLRSKTDVIEEIGGFTAKESRPQTIAPGVRLFN